MYSFSSKERFTNSRLSRFVMLEGPYPYLEGQTDSTPWKF